MRSTAQCARIRWWPTFLRNDDGTWRRDDERHENTLVDTSKVPPLLAERGVDVECRSAFGEEQLSGPTRTRG